MAKWGEGDPRWIVEERPDATNVNNWHWTERNAKQWSVEKLRELFLNVVITSEDGYKVAITEAEKLEGDATVNNRKGKLIFFYEWNVVLKWTGSSPGVEGAVVEGRVAIPNLSEENSIADIDILVSTSDDRLKRFMNTHGKEALRAKVKLYISSLYEEFSKGMILPKKENAEMKTESVSNNSQKLRLESTVVSTPSFVDGANKVEVTTVTQNVTFQCKAQELYDSLTKPVLVSVFTRSQVTMEAVEGGTFSLFGGNITGKFEQLRPGKKIVQTWRYKHWPVGHYSKVTMVLEEMADHTALTVRQTGVPIAEEDTIRDNWDRYYWNSIKRAFGFGAFFTYH